MEKLAGIWIDKRVAKIVKINNHLELFHTIDSSIEEYHPKGGSGTQLKGGPQDVVQDSKYLERVKHQEKAFFKDIVNYINSSDQLVIFGPAQMGERFFTEISEHYPAISRKVKGVKTADSMTDNQVRAWVRDYFANEN